MTDLTHPCPGCDAPEIPHTKLACPQCWFRLPPALRWDLRASQGVDEKAHRRALAQAAAWYREDRRVHGSRRSEGEE